MARRILLVDDDMLLRRSLAFTLEKAGYEAVTAASAEDALAQVSTKPPDLILLDIGLPGMDGLDALQQLRRRMGAATPVIFLTARRRELDEVLGLQLGADDYVTKPFSPRELVSRVRAVLRRTEAASTSSRGELIEVDDRFKMDFGRREVWVDGKLVKLRPTEYRLLFHLVQNAGWVVTYDQLLSKVWGYEYRDEPHYVRLYINYLRQKIEEDPSDPKYILTERGIGYRFVDYRRQKESESSPEQH